MNAPDRIPLDRKTYLGGSDIAAIMGLSQWNTPLDIYMKKIGEAVETETDYAREKRFARGKRLEPIAIDMLIDEYGFKVTKRSGDDNPNRYTDAMFPFMRAEIDFEFEVTRELIEKLPYNFIDPALLGTIQNGEIKSVHPFAAKEWGEEFTEEVPVYYAAQSMYGLMVAEKKLCLYGTLVGAEDLVIYKIERDDEKIEGMREKAIEFWNRVVMRVPPDPVDMADMMMLLARRNGKPVILDDVTEGLLQQYRFMGVDIKQREDQREEIKFQICDFIRQQWGTASESDLVTDDAALKHGGRIVATWNKQSTNRIDTTALKEELPDVAAKYTKQTTTRVMRLKK